MTTPPERKTNKMRKMWAPEEIMEDGINCWVVSSEGNGLDPIVVMTPESLSAMRRADRIEAFYAGRCLASDCGYPSNEPLYANVEEFLIERAKHDEGEGHYLGVYPSQIHFEDIPVKILTMEQYREIKEVLTQARSLLGAYQGYTSYQEPESETMRYRITGLLTQLNNQHKQRTTKEGGEG